MTTATSLYLLYTLDLPVGADDVRLYGGLLVTQGEFRFALSKDQPYARLFPADVTARLDAPLGLKGLYLEHLAVTGHVYKKDDERKVDLALSAAAKFSSQSLSNFELEGTIVIEATEPRLAMATLAASPPLRLTQFLNLVFNGYAAWAAPVTDQFAFVNGAIYFLKPPENAPKDYTYSYQGVAYQPGYGVASKFLIFGQYEFDVSLVTTTDEFELMTRAPTTVKAFDLVTLNDTLVEISSKRRSTHLRVKSKINFFDAAPYFDVTADYDTRQGAFTGTVDADLGRLSIPVGGDQDVQLGISFAWAKDTGFRITHITGLPSNVLNLIDELRGLLNDSGGCEKIATEWLDRLTNTTIKPGLNGSPYKDGSSLIVPLKLTYTVEIPGNAVSADIGFEARFAIPSSLSDLPVAICKSVVDSTPSIAADVLKDPHTYEVIAFEIARRGGAQAFARMICRALEKAFGDLAKALAEAAEGVIAETIAIAAELAAQLIAAALFGVSFIMNALKEAWQDIKKAFGGGDTDRDNARKQIREVEANVEKAVDVVRGRIAYVQNTIVARTLTTTLDANGQIVTSVVWNTTDAERQDTGGFLACHLIYLAGEPGQQEQPILLDVGNATLPDHQCFAAVAQGVDYRMNAKLKTSLTGFVFMKPEAEKDIASAQETLRSIDDSVAHGFADHLDDILKEFRGYNSSGIESDWIYATTDVPSALTVGRSRIGINSRLVH